jgi:hypothetical protein
MWIKSILILSGLVFSGCAPYYEIGIGKTIGGNLQGEDPVGMIEMGLRRDRWSCGVRHMSHIPSGRPFNDDPDSWSDLLLCTYGN